MYRPVHSRRREHAEGILKRAGYAGGGSAAIEGGSDGIEPAGVEEPALPVIAPQPLPAPIVSSHRRLGRRARHKVRG